MTFIAGAVVMLNTTISSLLSLSLFFSLSLLVDDDGTDKKERKIYVFLRVLEEFHLKRTTE